MQRLLCALVAAMALSVTAGAGTALAGGSLPVLGGGGPRSQSGQSGQTNRQDQSVSISNYQDADQSNATLNVPINVAALNSGGVDRRTAGWKIERQRERHVASGVAGRELGKFDVQPPPGGSYPASQPYGACQDRAPQGGGQPEGSRVTSPSRCQTRTGRTITGNLVVNVPVNAAITNGSGGDGNPIAVAGAWSPGSKDSPSPERSVERRGSGVGRQLNAASQAVSQDQSSSQQSSASAPAVATARTASTRALGYLGTVERPARERVEPQRSAG